MFDSEQVGDAAANRARIAAMQEKEAAEEAAKKAAKQAEKDKLRRAKRFMDPLMAITGVGTRILGIRPTLKTMVLDRLGSTKQLSGPRKALPRPRDMAKGGSYFKGNF